MRAVAGLIALMFMASTLVSPLYLLYRDAFGFSEVTLTLVYAVYVVGNLAALIFLGGISDAAGRKRIAGHTIALAAASVLLFLFAEGTAWLFAARTLNGFAVALASGVGTAWLAELPGGRDKARATLIATMANFAGLALGGLVGGLLAQYAPWPLHLGFIVYLVLLAALALALRAVPETVARPSSLRRVSLAPRLGVPPGIRAGFLAPAACAFCTFSLGGFYLALAPVALRERLGIENHAVSGLLLFELFLLATLAMLATRRLAPGRAMLAGLVLLLPSVGLLVLADALASLPLLLADSALTGLCLALGYRGSLQVVNRIAPPAQRAEVVSSYFVACFLGNSIPVIGLGAASAAWGPMPAIVAFAAVIAALTLAALAAGMRYRLAG